MHIPFSIFNFFSFFAFVLIWNETKLHPLPLRAHIVVVVVVVIIIKPGFEDERRNDERRTNLFFLAPIYELSWESWRKMTAERRTSSSMCVSLVFVSHLCVCVNIYFCLCMCVYISKEDTINSFAKGIAVIISSKNYFFVHFCVIFIWFVILLFCTEFCICFYSHSRLRYPCLYFWFFLNFLRVEKEQTKKEVNLCFLLYFFLDFFEEEITAAVVAIRYPVNK